MQDKPLLFDLAQLLEAGIAPVEAISRLQSGRAGDDRLLTQLHGDLQRGHALATALSASGFTTRLETEILKAAETAGKTTVALRLIAANYERRRTRTQSLRLRLRLPNFVLFVALAIQVVRATTAGTPLGTAIIGPGIIALVVVLLSQLLLAFLARDDSYWQSFGWGLGLNKSSDLFRQFFEQTFYTLFMWQTDAGLDYAAGAKTLGSLVDCKSYRNTVTRYQQQVTRGEGVTDALSRVGLLVPGELQQVMKVGEQTGRLAPALQHYLDIQGEHLERATNNIYTWLPRIYYIIVLAIGAATVI